MLRKAAHSDQNRRFLALHRPKIDTKITNISGTIYYAVTIFHMIDNTTAIQADTICAVLSECKYLGFTPTEPRATTERNGRNWKLKGLISTHAGNIKNDTKMIHKVNIPLCFIKQQLLEKQSG